MSGAPSGDDDSARAQLEEGLTELDAGDDLGRGVVPDALGLLAARRGQHAEVRARFGQGIPLVRASAVDHWDLALLLLNAGLEGVRAQMPESRTLLVARLCAWRQLGSLSGTALAWLDSAGSRLLVERHSWPVRYLAPRRTCCRRLACDRKHPQDAFQPASCVRSTPPAAA